jgi:hypothetical protein
MNAEQQFTVITLGIMLGCHILLFILNKANHRHKLFNSFVGLSSAFLSITILHVVTVRSEIGMRQFSLIPVIVIPQIIQGILDSGSKVGGGTTKLQNLILSIILSFIFIGTWYVLAIL